MINKSIYRLVSALAFAGGLCFAGPAFAAPCDGPVGCVEIGDAPDGPPGQDLGTLTLLGLRVDGAIVDHAGIPTHDVDFYKFHLDFASTLKIFTEGNGDVVNNTLLAVFDLAGVLLAFNDDDPSNVTSTNLSRIEPLSLAGGDYFAAVSGGPNFPNKASNGASPGCAGACTYTSLGSDPTHNGTAVAGAPADTSYEDNPAGEEPGYFLNITCVGAGLSCGPVSGVPEPASWLLLGSGLVGLAVWRRRIAA